MNTLPTPRALPEDIEKWSFEIEELLAEWARFLCVIAIYIILVLASIERNITIYRFLL